jgi:MFS family permease
MFIVNSLSAIFVLALWLPGKGNAPIIAFAALYGFTSGAFVSLAPALIAQISNIREIGVRNGSLFAVVSIAALTGSPIGGALVTRDNGGFTYLQIFCGVAMVVGCVLFLLARAQQAGLRMKVV